MAVRGAVQVPPELGSWFHNIHLPDGTQTAPQHPLGDFPNYKWDQVRCHLPDDVSGLRVLDIGCNGGFYTTRLAQLGAHVTAVDLDPRYLAQTRWVAQQWGVTDRVDAVQAQVYELGSWEERFDLVLFLGVFYHLRYPLLALDMVRSRVRDSGRLVFQSLQVPPRTSTNSSNGRSADATGKEGGRMLSDRGSDPSPRLEPNEDDLFNTGPPEDPGYLGLHRLNDAEWPRMCFVEGTLIGDPTNWWIPDADCVAALLRASGFAVEGRTGDVWGARPVVGEGVDTNWNRSEYRAILGLDWRGSVAEKVRPREGTLERPTAARDTHSGPRAGPARRPEAGPAEG